MRENLQYEKQLTAKDIQSTFCTRISIDNPKYVYLRVIVFLDAHECGKGWIALETLQFLKSWQIKNVEATACRYDQDSLLNLEKHDVFVKSEASQYFWIVLLHNSQLLGTEVIFIVIFVQIAADNEKYLLVYLHEFDLVVVDFAHLLDLSRLRLPIWIRCQAGQEYSFVRAHEHLHHLVNLAIEVGVWKRA